MSIRQFKLMHGASELDLNVKGGTFLSTPQGLGVKRSVTFVQIGNSFATSQNKVSQGEISCEMIFASYAQYQAFISFCSYDDLVFMYKLPGDTNWYSREVVLISCEKGEIGEGNVLHCATKFSCKTNWYKETSYTKMSKTDENKINFIINNNGDTECGYELEIVGNGDTITSIWIGAGFDTVNIIDNPFYGAIYTDYYYYLNTIDTHATIYRENPFLDPVDTVLITPDYSKNYFCKLPKTSENITVGITFEGEERLTATLKVREEYTTV